MDNQERQDGAVAQVSILGLIAVAVRNWRLIVLTILAVIALTITALLLRPDVYTTRTVLLPSEAKGTGATVMSGFPAALGGAAAVNQEQRVATVILRSGALVDSMVSLLGEEGWSPSSVRKTVSSGTEVTGGDAGSLAIEVSSSDPRLATEIANALPRAVNSIIANLGAQAAARKQAFLQAQIVRMEAELAQAEQKLVSFQQTQEAPRIDEQARRTLDVAAQVQLEIMDLEARIAALRRTTTPENPQLQAAIATLQDRRGQLRRLTEGTAGPNEVLVPLRESYELQLESARILREYERYQQVHASLVSNLIDSQIAAGNDLPVLSVLDTAKLPTAPRPLPLMLATVVAIMLGAIIGYLTAWLREGAKTMRRDPDSSEFFAAMDQFHAEIRRLVPMSGRRAKVVEE